MGGLLSKSKKQNNKPEEVHNEDEKHEDVCEVTDIVEKKEPFDLEPLALRNCHGEVCVRKPTPYGKTSLESVKRIVSVVNSSATNTSEPNSSMITNTSSGDLNVCPSKDVVTLSSSSSTDSE